MKRKVRTLIYGSGEECRAAGQLLEQLELLNDHHHEYRHVDTWDELGMTLVDWEPTLAIVLADGAAGMEGVYLVRSRIPELPVFWFSNDRDFSLQSHRLECVYFSAKPITSEKMRNAFRRCAHVGIRFDSDRGMTP